MPSYGSIVVEEGVDAARAPAQTGHVRRLCYGVLALAAMAVVVVVSLNGRAPVSPPVCRREVFG